MDNDLMQRLQFCLQHQATGALTPPQLMAEAFGLLENQQARIAALEAVVAAGDRLAGVVSVIADMRGHAVIKVALTTYRAAKEASHE